ncbi:MAG: DUF2779 domain-containing protein [Nitrospirae bacterium]|nr:DUF2779 domain-containing protein [Nitrospirota bacterium]
MNTERKDSHVASKKKPSSTHLSKTLFMKGLQCHKALYLEKYSPELKGELDANTQQRMAGGHEVGEYAHELFPGGIEVPYDGLDYSEQLEMTQNEIRKGTKTIYEAAFSFDGIFVKLDIINKTPKGWDIYEVKAANDVKDHYLNDLSLQYYVATKAGLPVRKAHLVHLNRAYIRKGKIDPEKLFIVEEMTSEVKENQAFIAENVGELKEMLVGAEPVIDIGKHCEEPYECGFQDHCRAHLPKKDSIFDLCGSKEIKFELYYEGFLGMDDLPLPRLEARQRFQVEAHLGKKQIINKTGVKDFLDSLSYPLCFFDFETFQLPIPPFNGTYPYQKIPFQYSLHIIERKGTRPKHYEYLAEPGKDPREEIAKRMYSEIPANACVLAYHKSFETGILTNLKGWFPKYAKKMDGIIDNMKDLQAPFAKRHVYHWKMQGSASLKTVLPALIPEMTYDGMEVSHGGEAQEAYFEMCSATDPAHIRKALFEYCKQDTLAMVKLLEKLYKMI